MPWDYNKTEYDKQAKKDPRWALERKILYGLADGEKISRKELLKYIDELHIPEERRAFLKLLLKKK
ncbi:MAG: hypothetical protein Q8P45_01955 [Candidatus Harrisonbacteria bacterium]|nr:hypothetical protein [Candidatus Harrisonbacteria bacterium]